MEAAQRHGTIVSYDLNYRPSLWKSIGGQKRAQEVNRELAPLVDVMLGNEEDFTAALGFEVEGLDENLSALDPGNFRRMIEKAVKEFPNFAVVATTLRTATTATLNDWGAVCCQDGRVPRGAHPRRPRNLRSRRRRRLLRLRPHLRLDGGQGRRSGPSNAAPPTAPWP